MKYIFSGFIGFAICLLLTGFFVSRYWPRPVPGEPVKVIEYPTSPDKNSASRNQLGNESTITIQGQGHLTGSVALSQTAGQNKPIGPNASDYATGQNNGLKVPLWALYDGDKIAIPVQGELKTVYYNSRTGEQIGTGDHRISGETILTVDGGKLQTDTIFDNTYRIVVGVPNPPRVNHIGLYSNLASGWSLGGYYQRDVQFLRNTYIFGRFSVDQEFRVTAGMEYQF